MQDESYLSCLYRQGPPTNHNTFRSSAHVGATARAEVISITTTGTSESIVLRFSIWPVSFLPQHQVVTSFRPLNSTGRVASIVAPSPNYAVLLRPQQRTVVSNMSVHV